MTTAFLHGVETLEITDGLLRPIQTVRSSVIGVIGTAPSADTTALPLNTPKMVFNPREALALVGNDGTLADALRGIYARAWPICVVVRVEEGQNSGETLANVVGDSLQLTGAYAFLKAQNLLGYTPRILIAPGFTTTRPTDGISEVAVGAGGTDYSSGVTVTAAAAPSGGRTAELRANVTAGVITSISIIHPGFGYAAAPTITITDAEGSGATATATLGTVANPVASALLAVAPRLRATVFVDAPASTKQAALDYAGDFGSDRFLPIASMGQILAPDGSVISVPASAYFAGLQAWVDNTLGFWWSLSNQELFGILGASRPIDFRLNDANSEANYLNENGIATIVRYNGIRAWGNRTTATDPLWAFLSVRRTADMIYESIEQAMLWALDRPIYRNTILEIQESVRAYMRHLAQRGAILPGGNAWIDPSINTPDQLVSGRLFVDFDFEPPAPLERLTFRAHRNPDLYEEMIADVVRQAA